MSDTQPNLRLRLGPVARDLIDGQTENRQQALDDAITRLLWNQKGSEDRGQTQPDVIKEIEIISDAVDDQTRAFTELKEIIVPELKMTRLMMQMLLKESENDNEHLRELTDLVMTKIYERTTILSDDDISKLQDMEERMHDALRVEMERAAFEERSMGDEELDR